MIAIGGGREEGSFGLSLECNFRLGSTGACDTFKNEPLCDQENFEVVDVEVYSFLLGQFYHKTIKYKSTSMIAVLIVVYAWQLLNPVLVATFVIVIRTCHILGIDPGEASFLWSCSAMVQM